ncbi:MAG: IclR family transcriptional regulator [Armatimonadetes bacterium]|nr:IclR family transcriptional regulator [Armatimonadota bacterium]
MKSLGKALNLLEIVTAHEGGIGIMELADKSGIGPSTTHRLLNALIEYGYVRQDGQREKYQTGRKVIQLARVALANHSLRTAALPHMKELRDRTGETVHISVIDGDIAVLIESIESTGSIRVYSPVGGGSGDFHCTSIGKVLLAYMPEQQADAVIARGLRRYTANTITSPEKLREQLREIRKSGVAFDDEEREIGVRCVAAPIVDYTGKTVAAMGISAPSVRLTEENKAELAEAVKETAYNISRSYAGL